MTEFFQTRMGQKFYEADIPRIAKALESIAKSLEILVCLARPSTVVTKVCIDPLHGGANKDKKEDTEGYSHTEDNVKEGH